MNDAPPRWFTKNTASRATGVGTRVIEKALRDGSLASYRLGAWRRIRPADLAAWLERQRRGGREGDDQ